MSHLIESIQSLVSAELLSDIAASTGENETQLSNAIRVSLPALLYGLLYANPLNHKTLNDSLTTAGMNTNFIDTLWADIRSGNTSSVNFSVGAHFMSDIFDKKTAGVTNLISNQSGIRPDAAVTLLEICAAITASYAGGKMQREGLRFAGILNWLGDQREVIESALLPTFIGFIQQTESEQMNSTKNSRNNSGIPQHEGEREDGMKWLLPLLLIVFISIGVWYWMMSGKADETEIIATPSLHQTSSNNTVAKDSIPLIEDSRQLAEDSVDQTKATKK